MPQQRRCLSVTLAARLRLDAGYGEGLLHERYQAHLASRSGSVFRSRDDEPNVLDPSPITSPRLNPGVVALPDEE